MNRIRSIACIPAGLAATLLAFSATAPAALATLPPPGGATGGGPATVRVIAGGGMPGWQITLIAVAAALTGAAVAVLLDRARATRRTHAAAA